MAAKPRMAVVNPTCLDVIDNHRAWVESQGIELIAEQSFRNASQDQLLEVFKGCEAVVLPAIVRGMPLAEQMAQCPRLLVCAIAASGFEWLDIDAATRSGIVVCYAPGGLGAIVVAEMALGLMLAVARQIPAHHERLSRGDATRGMGFCLTGKTLGIIGLGAIGKELAIRANGLRMRVIASDPFADAIFAAEHHVGLVTLDELLPQSDFVSLHVRLNEQTQNMIGRRELKLMKQSAILINAARRELVDEAALVSAISEGQIGGAGLDDPPGAAAKALMGRENVVFTPHIGNRAIEGVNGVCRSALEGAIAVLRRERPKFVVNPAVFEKGVRAPKCGVPVEPP